MRCRVCGQDNPPRARFCTRCAALLDAEPGERLLLTLAPSRVAVAPGASASATLTVVNGGALVENATLALDGAAAAWTTVEPRRLPVMSAQSGTAQLTVSPPRSAGVGAGQYALIVRARASDGGAVLGHADAVVTVAPFAMVAARVVPKDPRRWRTAAVVLELVNEGNEAAALALAAADDEGALSFRRLPPSATVPVGATVAVRFRVAARGFRLVGVIAARPYELTATAADGQAFVAQATLRQRAFVSPTAIAVFVALMALWLLLNQ